MVGFAPFSIMLGGWPQSPGSITPIGPVQTLTPGPTFNGTPGSGFGGSPPTKTGLPMRHQPWMGHMGAPTLSSISGGTLAPAGHFVWTNDFLPDGALSDDIFVAVDAESYNDQCTVTFNFEGRVLVLGPNDRQRATIERWDDETRGRFHLIKLSRAAWASGAAELWATISCAPLADRVIGPIRQHLRTAPDRVITVGTGLPTVAGVSYPTLQAAQLYASTNSADAWIKINFTTDMVVDGSTWGVSVASSNSRRGIVDVSNNGYNVTVMRPTKGLVRPGLNGLVWRGLKIDMTNIEQIFYEPGTGTTADYRPMWIIGSDIGTSDRNELFRPGAARNVTFTHYPVGMIGNYVHDIAGGDWASFHRFGNKIMRKAGDVFHINGWQPDTASAGSTYAKYNKPIDCTSEYFRIGVDAIVPTYGGAGTGTWEVSGGTHGGSGRSLLLKVNGTTVSTVAISNTEGSGNFLCSDVATAIAAVTDWTCPLLDNTRKAAYLGSNETGASTGVSGVAIKTHIFMHGDIAQTNEAGQHDGFMVSENEGWDIEAQTFYNLGTNKAAYNCFHRNNGILRPNGTVKAYQWQINGDWFHCGFDQNSHPNQTLQMRYDGGTTFDDYCTFTGNIVEAIIENGTPVSTPITRGNHSYGGGTLTGATQATTGGSSASDFPGIAAPTYSRDDFLPAPGSPLLGYPLTQILRFDMAGVDRTGQAFKGAVTTVEVADVTLTELTGTFTLAEDAISGALAGVLYGKAASATLSLTNNAGGRVALNGIKVVRGATALDYETATSHSFTVRQTLPDARTIDTTLTLAVTDVLEITTPVSAIAANGWQATMITPADLSFAPASLSRQGFNSSGSAITIAETLVTTKRVRLPYPNQASLTTADVALSDYVYSTDTLAGATNNSTQISPVPIAEWVTPDRAVVGNSLVIDLVAFHRNGRSGKPVAAVTGTATDGTTTVTALTSTPIILGHAGDKNPVIGYRLTFDVTTLTDQTAITVNGKVYPHIGGSASVLDSSTGVAGDRGFVPMVFLKHTARAANPPYAYVISSGTDAVVDANGVAGGLTKVSTTFATAAANPFASVVSAINALKAATSVTGGFTTGCIIRIGGTIAYDAASFISATYQNGGELIFEGVTGSTPVLTFGAANRNSYQPYMRFRNLALNRTGGANAIGSTTTVRLVLENVTMDGGSAATALAATGAHTWIMGLTITNVGSNLNFGTGQQLRLARGIAATGNFNIENWLTLGCNFTGNPVAVTVTARPPSGGAFAFNKVLSITGSGITFALGTVDIGGFAFVQNVLERSDTTNQTGMRASADADTSNITHLVDWNNSIAGFGLYGRSNILYDETAGTARNHKLQSFRGNIHAQLNHKSDIFIADGSRIGAWGYGNGVGCIGEMSQFVDAGPNLLSFRQDYPGLKANIGQSQTVRNDPLFTAYAGTTNTGSTPVAGAGGGTYTLQSGSPAIGVLTTAEDVLPFDLAGNVRDRGSVGAYR